ncbi:MAG: glycosyltransferase [Bacteroidales bacterium]|nr:glycosyltransferase [Bacteroidales bacterium]
MTIDIVIVTFNRLQKLKKALDCYDSLTVKPRNIIVVNNNSNDGTKEYLNEWREKQTSYSKHILHLDKNVGGSGGFYKGQKFALSLNPDWIMLADDDAYPTPDLIEKFEQFVTNHKTDTISAICSTVLRIDGTIDATHRSRYHLIKGLFYERTRSNLEDYEQEWFEIDFLSYVGCFLKKNTLLKAGLVNPEFFIHSDDTEHSIRLKKQGKIICVPELKIYHDDNNTRITNEISWKDYYSYRNELYMLKKHHPLAAIAWSRRQLNELKNEPEKLEIYKTAMKDAWLGKLGVHYKYYPGWTKSE